jgi:hypothetical protein
VIDERDAGLADAVRALGLACVVTDTMMDELEVAATLAGTCLALAARIRDGSPA